jgi:HAD superfamily hydrolase (TIGR01458 family)
MMLDLRTALRGVRGLLLDLDGVVILAGKLIPGAADALRELDRRGMPYRIVTNTSLVTRATLAARSAQLGAPIPADRFHSSLSATAAWTAARHRGESLFVLASADALTEFAGQRVLTDEEAARPDARAAAVVIGYAPESTNWDTLNRAFRLVRNGAALIGMHKSRWWFTPDGPTIDSGAIVAALEYATGVRARILGKPSRLFFGLAAEDLAVEIGARDGRGPIHRADLAMVGDDVWTDALAARRAGLRGVMVLSGKHGADELARAAGQARGGGHPDAVAPSLADVVAALD